MNYNTVRYEVTKLLRQRNQAWWQTTKALRCPYLETCGRRYWEGQAKIHLPGLLRQTGNNTENRLKTRLAIPHGEIMRLLFIISASCMTANLFPSGQMICSSA